MGQEEIELVWRELSGEAFLEVKGWRLQHPRASIQEIEEAMDRSLGKARARFIQEVALASDAKEVGGGPDGGGTKCPQCGHLLESRGERTRRLSTHYDQRIELNRSYGFCPACETGIFSPG